MLEVEADALALIADGDADPDADKLALPAEGDAENELEGVALKLCDWLWLRLELFELEADWLKDFDSEADKLALGADGDAEMLNDGPEGEAELDGVGETEADSDRLIDWLKLADADFEIEADSDKLADCDFEMELEADWLKLRDKLGDKLAEIEALALPLDGEADMLAEALGVPYRSAGMRPAEI